MRLRLNMRMSSHSLAAVFCECSNQSAPPEDGSAESGIRRWRALSFLGQVLVT